MNPIVRLIEILRSAEVKEVAEKRCLIIPRSLFWEALALMAQAGMDARGDDALTRKHMLDNFELILTFSDKHPYYVCTKSEPIIDAMWEAKK